MCKTGMKYWERRRAQEGSPVKHMIQASWHQRSPEYLRLINEAEARIRNSWDRKRGCRREEWLSKRTKAVRAFVARAQAE